MKTVFILFFILTDPTGGDSFQTMPISDLHTCERQRHWMQTRGIITGDRCMPVNYRVY